MATVDQVSDIRVLECVAVQAIGSDTTKAGAVIDTRGYESVTFLIYGATLTDGTYTPLINESDDSGMSGESAVADVDLVVPGVTSGQEAAAALAATNDNTVKRIGYVGSKRYVTCDLVSTGTTSGGTAGVFVVLGNPHHLPVAQA